MAGAYDDRDGKIWMDGKLVDWRDANVHILTHAMHYASSVFEGERCYSGKIFKSREHSERLLKSGELMDMEIPYTVDEIEAAKKATLEANGLTNAYLRVVCFRGAGPDMGVAASRNPVRMAVTAWEWGNYYGDAKTKGAKLDIAKWKRPSPEPLREALHRRLPGGPAVGVGSASRSSGAARRWQGPGARPEGAEGSRRR